MCKIRMSWGSRSSYDKFIDWLVGRSIDWSIDCSRYALMMDCWQESPERRPTFTDLVNRIELLLNPPRYNPSSDKNERSYINIPSHDPIQDYLKPISSPPEDERNRQESAMPNQDGDDHDDTSSLSSHGSEESIEAPKVLQKAGIRVKEASVWSVRELHKVAAVWCWKLFTIRGMNDNYTRKVMHWFAQFTMRLLLFFFYTQGWLSVCFHMFLLFDVVTILCHTWESWFLRSSKFSWYF